MLHAIQIPDDPAVLITDGDRIWSAVDGPTYLANVAAGIWPSTIEPATRAQLAGYEWSGPPVDYSTVDPAILVAKPGRTLPTDCRAFAS